MTGDQLPVAQVKRAQAWKYGPGTMLIHLALSGLPDWKSEGARQAFYVNIGPSLDYLAAAYQQCMAGLLPTEPFCVVAQPTLYDPSRAPAGQHVLWIMVRGVPGDVRGDGAGYIGGRSWNDEVKEGFADRVLDLIETYAPGLRKKILGKAVISPLDFEMMNPNLVRGDINAGSQHLSQFYGRRPFPEFPHYTMPIERLYMCGAATWPGGGANPTSGTLLAQQLLANGD
jgi:phytoene dehydrogenase-like protein